MYAVHFRFHPFVQAHKDETGGNWNNRKDEEEG